MNSRGEQLEKHEIIKARLIEQLDNEDKKDKNDKATFNRIWEFCSENVLNQLNGRTKKIAGN